MILMHMRIPMGRGERVGRRMRIMIIGLETPRLRRDIGRRGRLM
jgi:hypothetical protein